MLIAILICLICIAIFILNREYKTDNKSTFIPDNECIHYEKPDPLNDDMQMQRKREVHDGLSKLIKTDDIDPLITGHLYDRLDGMRNIYSEIVGHGDKWGLTEFSSSGHSGDVGIDVGPYGLYEYGGRNKATDDGIPPQWRISSRPPRYYKPKKRDYYGIEGPTPYTENLVVLAEPDHDPLVN